MDALDRRITAALQIDGRASWRKIATVLGEPERSITRRGSNLLASGAVSVVGLRTHDSGAVLRLQCSPGAASIAAEALAQRRDSTFSYLMTGGADCVAEINVERGELATALETEVPATTGLAQMVCYPVLCYYRTVRGWRAPGLTTRESAELSGPLTLDRLARSSHEPLAVADQELIDALVDDGRSGVDTLARRLGVSQNTVSRRLEVLLRSNRVQIRALVEPALVGLGVEAVLWITLSPTATDRVGRALAAQPEVRYAAAVAGPHQLVADVTVAGMSELYEFITTSPWVVDAHNIDVSVLLSARKRGGRRVRRLE